MEVLNATHAEHMAGVTSPPLSGAYKEMFPWVPRGVDKSGAE
jgi:hypothetical protein